MAIANPAASAAPRAGSRAAGFGLIALGFAPLVVIVGGAILIGLLMVQTVGIVTSRVAAVSQIAVRDIEPQIQAVQDAYSKLATEAQAMKSQLDGAMATLAKLEDARINAGQFGSTPGLQIKIPDHEVSVAGGVVAFSDGQLFDKALPSVQIPPAPAALPLGPMRESFGPFGPDGAVGRAIGKATGELRATLDEAAKLKQPLLDIKDAVLTIPEPLRSTFERLVIIFTVGAVVLAALLIGYFIVATTFIVRRWSEASVSYRSGGMLGLMLYSHRTMIGEGTAKLLGREPPNSVEQQIFYLKRDIEFLTVEVAELCKNDKIRL